jgi:hypothetical protein
MLNTNRKYLARALALGFREVQLVDPTAPAVCRDEQRTYVWALLEPDGVIAAAENALRTSSPAAGATPPASTPVNRIAGRLRKRGRATAAPSNSKHRAAPPSAPDTQDVIAYTLALHTQLRAVLHGLGDLVRQIRRDRKQARLTKSTLAALKQLQTLEV